MREPDKMFWSGKKVLITGHSGFKGRWLSAYLSALNAEVFGLAKDASPYLPVGAQEYIADIRNKNLATEILAKCQPEIIFHLAAVSTVQDGLAEPVAVYETNVGGTANLLVSSRLYGKIRAMVAVTSDKCYKNREWLWGYRENDELGGADPYSASKTACEFVVNAFRESFIRIDKYGTNRMSVATARCGNLIGGGDLMPGRLVPSLARNANKNQPIHLRNPDSVRPWLYVLDALRGYILLAENLYKYGTDYEGAWNFGPLQDDIRTVREMTESFCACWGSGTFCESKTDQATVETDRLWLDSTKSRTQIGWKPLYCFERLMLDTVDFYKEQLSEGRLLNELYPIFVRRYLTYCQEAQC